MITVPQIVPGSPLVPEHPPTDVLRRVLEWTERADLAQNAFDGQWRELMDYRRFGMPAVLMERWLRIPDDPDHIVMEHWVKRT